MEQKSAVCAHLSGEEEPQSNPEYHEFLADNESTSKFHNNITLSQVRQVYLVTYSQANLQKFATRRAFAECVVDAFGQTRSGVMYWVCCRETHKNNGKHCHMAVKLERLRRWKLVKNYLKDKHGIVVHFSNTHDNYYSAWKYVTKNDEEVLESPDHPTLWNSKPPRTQKASEARASEGRLKSLQHTNEQCEHEGVSGHSHKKKKRMSAFELSQIIVENEITTRTELLAFADQQKEEGKTDIAEFVVNRGARVVAEVIETAWEMKTAKQN